MTRIFRYILKTDTGMAPCIDRALVSLATCKPKIRVSGKIGDWVIGCRPSPAPRGLVVWAGRIASVNEVGDYERQYRGRSDAVYRGKLDGGFERLRPDYHRGEKEFRKDISGPALVFDANATWYFGADPQMLPDHLIHLAARGQGHRVNGVVDGDAHSLHEWLMSVARPGIHGVPRDAVATKRLQRC